MSKRSAVISLIIVAILLVIGVVIFRSEPAISPSDKTTSPTTDTPARSGEAGGIYTDYSQAALSEAKGTRILFFHASWCPQCRALEADIQQNGVPANTTILKVDYDKAQDLRKKYGVTLQTTVVKVDENGNLISKFTPYQKPTLENALSNL